MERAVQLQLVEVAADIERQQREQRRLAESVLLTIDPDILIRREERRKRRLVIWLI